MTPYAITLVGGPPPSPGPTHTGGPVAELVETYGGRVTGERVLSPDYAVDLLCDLPEAAAEPMLKALRQLATRWDVAVQPVADRRKRLLCADMDSTIVQAETIDEMAAKLGVGEQVAAITERAMQGELDFRAALAERVALTKGLPAAEVIALGDSVALTPGAAALVATMKAHGARCVLVSGGFTLAAEALRRRVGFDRVVANTLEVAYALLTGRVTGLVVDASAKLAVLREESASLGIEPSQTLVLGDGANDAQMIQAAGLGVAYRGKPALKAAADAWIDHGDLRGALYFQGYDDSQIRDAVTTG